MQLELELNQLNVLHFSVQKIIKDPKLMERMCVDDEDTTAINQLAAKLQYLYMQAKGKV